MAKVVVSPWGATSKHKYAASEEGKEEQAPSDGGALKPSAELIAEVERVRVRLKNSGDRWVLDPSTKHYRRWDFMTFTALVFTAVVTPVRATTSSRSSRSRRSATSAGPPCMSGGRFVNWAI